MAELQRKKQKSVGTVCKDAIMTGISYMIPVIVGGGVITAIAKMMGGYNIGDTAAEMQTLAQVIFTIGNNLFAFAVPCLAAFIAYAIADKPGIAPGYAMGVLAGLMKTGFVGGLVGALIAGWFVLQMKKIKVPKALQGIMPIMFIPVLSTLIVGLLMWYVIGVPIAWLMGIVTGWLTALSAGSRFVLGAVIGAMIAFDNGGPVNKTAALFVNGLNADGFFIPTSAKMCAGMTSPLGIAISTVLPWSRNKFTNVRRTQQIASLAHGMGLSCEAELGHVGQAAQADDSNVDLYTNVKQAKEFVERTNCDCLAVAIGTAHGAYPKGMIPKLDFERLKELKAELDMPLVLHGGSGAGEENIRKAVACGINKINVCSVPLNLYPKE